VLCGTSLALSRSEEIEMVFDGTVPFVHENARNRCAPGAAFSDAFLGTVAERPPRGVPRRWALRAQESLPPVRYGSVLAFAVEAHNSRFFVE
jgi:hypothetical protein